MSKKSQEINPWNVIFLHLLAFRWKLFITSAFGILGAVAAGLSPFIIGIFYDDLVGEPSPFFVSEIFTLPVWQIALGAWLILRTLTILGNWITQVAGRYLGTHVMAEYKAKAMSHLLTLPVSFHKEKKVGEIFEIVQRGGSSLTMIIGNVLADIAPLFLTVAVGLTVAVLIHPIVGGIICAGILLYVAVLIKIVPPIVPLQKQVDKAYSKASGTAHDALVNVHMVKRATAEEFESRRIWRAFVKNAAEKMFHLRTKWAKISTYQQIIFAGTQVTMLGVSAHFFFAGDLTIGSIIALGSYASMVFNPFIRLGYNWETIQNGLNNITRAEKILQTPSELYIPKEKVVGHRFLGGVAFENVAFAYPDDTTKLVLRKINFSTRPGEIVALVGKSGVGKSTITELLSAYYFATKGRVLFDDIDVRQIPLTELRNNIAIVPQEVILFHDTILANIRYGSFGATNLEVETAAKIALADEFITTFPKKYRQVVGERGIKLSVGQKQRIAIARAVLKNPTILILDEPTSALDAETESYITKSLEKLMEGRTTFVVAHRLSTVRRADKILVFEKGKIAEIGTHQELLTKNGVYANLHKLQTEWY